MLNGPLKGVMDAKIAYNLMMTDLLSLLVAPSVTPEQRVLFFGDWVTKISVPLAYMRAFQQDTAARTDHTAAHKVFDLLMLRAVEQARPLSFSDTLAAVIGYVDSRALMPTQTLDQMLLEWAMAYEVLVSALTAKVGQSEDAYRMALLGLHLTKDLNDGLYSMSARYEAGRATDARLLIAWCEVMERAQAAQVSFQAFLV